MTQPPKCRSLVCWGCGEFGQHCQSGKSDDVSYPNGVVLHPALTDNVVLAACGSSHTVVCTRGDELYAWGNGACGQLGTGQLLNTAQPVRLQLDPCPPNDTTVSSIACGTRHTMVLLTNGHVYAFGNNFYAQLGYDFRNETYKENQSTPSLLRYLVHYHVTQVACGDKHTLFLFQDGTVSAVGHNSHGQIGDGGRHEAVVPKSVNLDSPVVSVACGRDHNLVLSDSGDVYVWGHCKGCGHRRNDVLSPELKLRGRQIVQVAGGATHSLALARDGNVYSWGFGSDGQLGLGETKLSASSAKRIRHESLRQRVSFIGCGETYSAAITSDGRLYMWGKNSHVISVSHAASKAFFHPVPVDQDERLDPVHSVYCGSWHALGMAGIPDSQPAKCDGMSDTDSDSDGDLTSGSSAPMSRPGSQGAKQGVDDEENQCPFPDTDSPIEKSVPPRGHQGPESGSPTSPSRSASGVVHSAAGAKISPPTMTGRGQTRLTIGEFYALTDSSPSQNGSHSSISQHEDAEESTGAIVPVPVVQVESPKDGISITQEPETALTQETETTTPYGNPKNMQDVPVPKLIQHRSAPTSAKSSSGSSEVSESSLKKRMAENLSANNAFRSREWAGNHQPRQRQLLNKNHARSPSRPLPLASPSPLDLSPRSPNLIPRARSSEQVGRPIDRSHTMYISRTPAEQFLLPRREPTFMACQSLALVDLNELKAGSMFDQEEINGTQARSSGGGGGNNNNGHGEVFGGSQGQEFFQGGQCQNRALQSQGHNTSRSGSSAASRLDMVYSPTDCESELSQVLRQRTPQLGAPAHLAASHVIYLSSSETPSSMSHSYQRNHDLLGAGPGLGQYDPPALFASPAPNLGRQVSNPLLRRSRTMHGQTSTRGAAKYYRKPGLPGATYKPVKGPGAVRSLLRQTTSLEALPRAHTFNGGIEVPDLAILTANQASMKHQQNQRTGAAADDVTTKRAVFSSASSWRSRQHTTLGLGKDSAPPPKNVQLHLNGIGSKSSALANPAVAPSVDKHLKDLSVLSAKAGSKKDYHEKPVTFTDLKREVTAIKNAQRADIRVKSVKKYR